jgi:hypothetical protein
MARFERIEHEVKVALTGARDVSDPERTNKDKHWAGVDRGRVLQHLHAARAAVHSLLADLDGRPAKRPARPKPKPPRQPEQDHPAGDVSNGASSRSRKSSNLRPARMARLV